MSLSDVLFSPKTTSSYISVASPLKPIHTERSNSTRHRLLNTVAFHNRIFTASECILVEIRFRLLVLYVFISATKQHELFFFKFRNTNHLKLQRTLNDKQLSLHYAFII